jgi:glycosyltransferase involved in cell wall biosynthesis
MNKRLKIFTWHVHGSYLYYLTHTNADFYVPVKKGVYLGRSASYPWPNNLYEIPVKDVKKYSFDCILYQSEQNYLFDQYECLSTQQRNLPKIYLEHNPPREHPTDTKHIVDDPNILLVHVAAFNKLMWDNNHTPTKIIDHGIVISEDVKYSGHLAKGIVVVNNLESRGRRLGFDIFIEVKKQVPLDLVGINANEIGGLGEIKHDELPAFMANYRFFFNPIRYTSLGMAVCEAMMSGVPIVGMATHEVAATVENGISGFIDTNIDKLVIKMKLLLDNPMLAKKMGQNASVYANKRFNISRFKADWLDAFNQAIEISSSTMNKAKLTV